MFVGESVCHAYWDLETIGMKNEADNMEDSAIIDHFKISIVQVDSRYQVCWPWKLSKCELPTNYSLALARLRSLLRSLKTNKLKIVHDDIIRQ